ncbi:MAG: hypothetical protein ACRENE_32115 [Polyangiaceae bacterium]
MARLGRPRLAALSLLGGLAGVAVAGGGLTACPGTATVTIVAPVEGVTLHLADVLGSLRCGTGPGDVYKYTVVVWAANPDDAATPGDAGEAGEASSPESSTSDEGGSGDAGDAGDAGAAGSAGDTGGVAVPWVPTSDPLFSNVFDCFSDAVLDNLVVDGGSMQFFLRVYGYSYEGALLAATGSADGDVSQLGAFWCQGGLGANGASCQFQDAGTAYSLGAKAQWATTCSATEPAGAPITAVCGPLEPVAPASSDAAAEAGPDAAGDATQGPDASDEAGEASSPESSPSDSSSSDASSDSASGDSATQDVGDAGVSDAAGPDSGADTGASDSSAQDASTDGG